MPQATISTERKKVSILDREAISPANGGTWLVGAEPVQELDERIGKISPPPEAQPSRIASAEDCVKPFPDESGRAFHVGGSLTELMGTSPQMLKIIEAVESVARSPFAVLIEGETGTGKELIVRAIHGLSARPAREFVAVDCGAIPETLIESELFGHEKGAFTGAHQRKDRSVQLAHGGSLFLDEIANLPLTPQSKLLRTLQERKVHPLGAKYALPVHVRIIAASNVPLVGEMRAGRFRHDLYYRLSEFVVTLPPLRERVEDILYLASRFQTEASLELRRPPHRLSEEAAQLLLHYPWPGNVRELRNVMRRAALLTCDGTGSFQGPQPSGCSAWCEGQGVPKGRMCCRATALGGRVCGNDRPPVGRPRPGRGGTQDMRDTRSCWRSEDATPTPRRFKPAHKREERAMKRLKRTAVQIGLVLTMVSAAAIAAVIPTVNANNDDNGGVQKLFLAGKRTSALETRIPGNDLVESPPPGPLTVIVPDDAELTTAVWKSAPLTQAALLLPGSVTLDLLVKNYSENPLDPSDPVTEDVCFSKRISLAGETPGSLVVAAGCFENPFPAVGPGTCPPGFFLGQHPPAPGCAPQGVMTMAAATLVVTPTTIPAGSREELRIWTPVFSLIGAFFNGKALGAFSTLKEPKCPVEDDNDLFNKLADLNNNGVPDGNEDRDGNGAADEDEDDDDACPERDSDGNGVADEDEDD